MDRKFSRRYALSLFMILISVGFGRSFVFFKQSTLSGPRFHEDHSFHCIPAKKYLMAQLYFSNPAHRSNCRGIEQEPNAPVHVTAKQSTVNSTVQVSKRQLIQGRSLAVRTYYKWVTHFFGAVCAFYARYQQQPTNKQDAAHSFSKKLIE